MMRTVVAVGFALLVVGVAACGGGGGGGGAKARTARAIASSPTVILYWSEGGRLKAIGDVLVDAEGRHVVDAEGNLVRTGEWRWYFDVHGSPISRVERFDDVGVSLDWIEYNNDEIDLATDRGSVRDTSADAR